MAALLRSTDARLILRLPWPRLRITNFTSNAFNLFHDMVFQFHNYHEPLRD